MGKHAGSNPATSTNGNVAQLVEHPFEARSVGGSIPPITTIEKQSQKAWQLFAKQLVPV